MLHDWINYFSELVKLANTNKETKTKENELWKDKTVNKLLENNWSKVKAFVENKYKKKQPNALLDIFRNLYWDNNHNSIITPFEFNNSQLEALEVCLNNQYSIVEGPPGCGKTQTILNLISSIILNGQNVAIVSNNNYAIKNVISKLEKYKNETHLYYFCLDTTKDDIDDNIDIEEITTTKFSEIKNLKDELKKFKSKFTSDKWNKILDNNYKIIKEYNFLNNKKLQLIIKLKNLDHQIRKYYDIFLNKDLINRFKLHLKLENLNEPRIFKIYFWLKNNIKINFFRKIYFWLYTFIPYKRIETNYDFFISYLEWIFLQLEHLKISREIDDLQFELDKFDDINKKTDQCYQISKDHLKTKIKEIINDPEFSKKQQLPIFLSTTYSFLKNLKHHNSNTNFTFDYLIFDEASQVDLLSGLPPTIHTKNLILVGDTNQLTPIYLKFSKKEYQPIYQKYDFLKNTDNKWQYQDNSIISFFKNLYYDNKKIKTVFLREHYRSNPLIINFCNQKFYQNKLIIHKPLSNASPLSIFLTDSQTNYKRENHNKRELQIIFENIEKQDISLNNNDKEIGIITPYKQQVQEIENILKETTYKAIDYGTIHKFQGQERKCIYISTVDNSIQTSNPFSNNPNLWNVAISRAQDKLILITSQKLLDSKQNTYVKDLINYINYWSDTKIESKIYSIFDGLWSKENKKLRDKLQEKYGLHTKWTTEQVTMKLLDEIIAEYKLDLHINYEVNYSIKRIFNISKFRTHFDYEAIKYFDNHLTSVDFVINEKLSNRLLFAIEVDGWASHKDKQTKDNWKDELFKINNIELLRLKTDDSGEKEKICKLLEKYLYIKKPN